MATNDSKYYLPYFNNLVDQCNNTYHHSINKKPINVDCSALTEKRLKQILNLLNIKLIIESELRSIRIFLEKVTLKIGQGKYLLLILVWKLIFGHIKSKIYT